MNTEQLYQEVILDHYRRPKNFGTVEKANATFKDSNPSCGDIIEMTFLIDKQNIIQDIKFTGKGCAISTASASMLTQHLKGKPLNTLTSLTKQDLLDMLGVELSGIRMKCALLSLKVAKMAAYNYLGEQPHDDFE
ncbi:MAG: SUF system NifU family Fe-S cluster assembly protein [Candidatus Nanoarchaeia archaeon]